MLLIFSEVGNSQGRLLAIRAQNVLLIQRFIGQQWHYSRIVWAELVSHPWQVDKFWRRIYLPTGAKGLNYRKQRMFICERAFFIRTVGCGCYAIDINCISF